MPPPRDIIEVATIDWQADHGQDCYVLRPFDLAGALPGSRAIIDAMSAVAMANPPCPATTAPPLRAVSPATLAEEFWETIPLPRPEPKLPPGYAITGKPIYLLTGDSRTPPPWVRQTPLGTLVVTARGTYTVKWGTGTSPAVSGPYSSTGGTYPHGTITHTYDVAGTYTIRVEETWSATWRLGDYGGSLQDLRTSATVSFPVHQVQAVLTG